MINIFRKENSPLVTVLLNDKNICQISKAKIPFNKRISTELTGRNSELVFLDHSGKHYTHSLANENGWIHFSVLINQNLGCQIDCIISEKKFLNENDFAKGKLQLFIRNLLDSWFEFNEIDNAIFNHNGIRFQPFFISGAKFENSKLKGKGLFERGLHFSGVVTPGTISLSCICDECEKSFRIKSFHAGFGNVGYFYSDSGLQTLVVSSLVEGAPPALGKPDFVKLAELEAHLPLAKDGTRFKYKNSFRCPHCGSAYIDFEHFPEQRETEYYGNYFYNDELIRYEVEKQ